MASSESSSTAIPNSPAPAKVPSPVVDLTIGDEPESSEDEKVHPEGAIDPDETPAAVAKEPKLNDDGSAHHESAIDANKIPATVDDELESSKDGNGPEGAIGSHETPVSMNDEPESLDGGSADSDGAIDLSELTAAGSKKKKDKRKSRRGPGKVTASAILARSPAPDPAQDSSAADSVLVELTEEQQEELLGFPRQQDPVSSNNSQLNDYVPVVPDYEVRRIPAGNENITTDTVHVSTQQYGLFATKFIPQGTRIINEAPLLTLPGHGEDSRRLLEHYVALTPAEQTRFWKLNPCPSSKTPHLAYMADIIDPVCKSVAALRTKLTTTPRETAELRAYGDKIDDAIKTLRIAARFHHASTYMQGEDSSYLFIEAGSLRHSCVANAFAHYKRETNRMTVQTLRDVEIGEELTMSDIDEGYLLNAKQRASLLEKRGIVCKCAACNPSSGKFFTNHEEWRVEVKDGFLALDEKAKAWPDYYCTSTVDNVARAMTLWVSTPPVTLLYQFRLAEGLGIQLMEALKKLQCELGWEIVQCMDYLVDKICPRLAAYEEGPEVVKKWGLIVKYSSRALKAAQVSCGKDSAEYKACESRSSRVKEEMKKQVLAQVEREKERKRLGL
jgi:hypothetical protein